MGHKKTYFNLTIKQLYLGYFSGQWFFPFLWITTETLLFQSLTHSYDILLSFSHQYTPFSGNIFGISLHFPSPTSSVSILHSLQSFLTYMAIFWRTCHCFLPTATFASVLYSLFCPCVVHLTNTDPSSLCFVLSSIFLFNI